MSLPALPVYIIAGGDDVQRCVFASSLGCAGTFDLQPGGKVRGLSDADLAARLHRPEAYALLCDGGFLPPPPGIPMPVLLAHARWERRLRLWLYSPERELFLLAGRYQPPLAKVIHSAEYAAAVLLVQGGKTVSTSVLQRWLGVPFGKAMNIVEALHAAGVVDGYGVPMWTD